MRSDREERKKDGSSCVTSVLSHNYDHQTAIISDRFCMFNSPLSLNCKHHLIISALSLSPFAIHLTRKQSTPPARTKIQNHDFVRYRRPHFANQYVKPTSLFKVPSGNSYNPHSANASTALRPTSATPRAATKIWSPTGSRTTAPPLCAKRARNQLCACTLVPGLWRFM